RAGVNKGLLDRIRLCRALRQPLDRDDLAVLGLGREHQACAGQLPVEVDRARSAFALFTCVLRPWQADPLTQHVKEVLGWTDLLHHVVAPVDDAADVQFVPSRYADHAQVSVRLASVPVAW